MAKEKMTYTGLHVHRLEHNPLEKLYAEAWNTENVSLPWQHRTLDVLLKDGKKESFKDVTPRDHKVAATVIQWLGSNVGQCFVANVLEKFKKGKQNENR